MKKTILITGSSRGIGAATALLAANMGYSVVINYLTNKQAADKIVTKISRNGGQAICIAANVAKENDIVRMFEQIDYSFGPLSALVNNVGIIEKQSKINGLDIERLHRVFSTNVFGTILCSREAVKRMARTNGGLGGAIVNVSSIASRYGSPFEYVDYAASKGAIDTFTIGLSKEVATDNIRVNAVRPGFIYTDIHALGGEPSRVDRVKNTVPMQRGGTPEEVAATILWLLSEEASYVTGAIIDVAGGR